MSRPRMAPAAVAWLAALGLAGPLASAQPPAVTGSAASDSGLPDPMASARNARHLMRNGQDYLSYKQYERALSFLRQAETRQTELSVPERAALRKAIERARQGMREPEAPTDSALARGRGPSDRPRDPQASGTFALARPIRDVEPIQLASAVVEAPKAPASPTVVADLPEASPVPAALPELPTLPGTAEPVAAPPALNAEPIPTPAPTPVPAAAAPEPEPLPVVAEPEPVAPPVAPEPEPVAPPIGPEPPPAALADPAPETPDPAPAPETPDPAAEPLTILSAQPEDTLPDLPPATAAAPAPAPAEVPTLPAETPAPEVPPIADPVIPAPEALDPAPIPIPAPADPLLPTAATPDQADSALPPPPEEAPPIAADPAPAPVAADPAALPELPPQVPAAALVPMPTPEELRSPRPGGPISTLSESSRREVEEVARRQDANSRRAPDAAPTNRTEQPIGVGSDVQTNRLELPRAPSPTEPRAIRPIPIDEEPAPMTPRRWEPTSKYWASVGSCHTPLYFQDAVLERYGQSVEQGMGPFGRFVTYRLDDPTQSNQRMQIAQPFVSLALFYGQVVALPYNLIVDPPWEAEYDLGYYRPGDRIPPDTYYLPWLGVGPPLKGRNYGGFHGHR